MTSKIIQQTHKKERVELQEAQSSDNKKAKTSRDQIASEFKTFDPELNFIYVICGTQKDDQALLDKQHEILSLPQGQDLFNALKKHLSENIPPSKIIGIVENTQKTMWGLKSTTTYSTIIAINAQELIQEKTLEENIYGLSWMALSTINDIRNNNLSSLSVSKESIYTPKWNDNYKTSQNLFADVFAGSILELNGKKNAIKEITKRKTIACFEDLKGYDALLNPLPNMLETIQMIYEDITNASSSDNNLEVSLNIVSETIDTMDENSIAQWQAFIEPAREMAWAGLPVSQILGAAIYTSDNVYNRTSAYMIAEILNTDPAPIIEFDGYNAFAETETQQRNHKIACLETFEFIQTRQIEKQNPISYFNMAEQSCEMLSTGKPNGFCAPALIACGQKIEATPEISKKELSNIYTDHINALPWPTIRNLHRAITELRKNNRHKGLASIVEILSQDEDTRDAAILINHIRETQK